MALDPDINGKVIRAPTSVYDLPWVKGTGFAKKSGDAVGTGWKAVNKIPGINEYFGHPGRHDAKAETEAMKTLGNKWVKK